MKDDERIGKEEVLADYIVETKGYHCEWALQCLGAQFLYLVNVIGQMFFTDCFLGWEFSKYGVAAAGFSDLDVRILYNNHVEKYSQLCNNIFSC